jgi:hypothetical protein
MAGNIAIRRRTADRGAELKQALATILFVDIVRSTEKAARLGDSHWTQVMNHYYAAVREGGPTPYEAAVQVREQARMVGRPLARRTVGSTLLLKGLEADVAVILTPELMDRQHLYVAMTRGARKLVICSDSPTLSPDS